LVKRWCDRGTLRRRYRAMVILSSPATACVLRRRHAVFGGARYPWLANF
jgi:hypothetical protein